MGARGVGRRASALRWSTCLAAVVGGVALAQAHAPAPARQGAPADVRLAAASVNSSVGSPTLTSPAGAVSSATGGTLTVTFTDPKPAATGTPYICEIKLGAAGRAYGNVTVDTATRTGSCTRPLYSWELAKGTMSLAVTIAPLVDRGFSATAHTYSFGGYPTTAVAPSWASGYVAASLSTTITVT